MAFALLITYISASSRSDQNKILVQNVAQEHQSNEVEKDSNAPLAQQIDVDPEEKPKAQVVETNFEYIDSGKTVLGQSDVAGCNPENLENCNAKEIAYQPVCAKADVDISTAGDGAIGTDTGNGVKVSKNAAIEIFKITSPLPILSGSEVIDTTAYAISKANPNFYSGVKLLREGVVAAKYTTPGEDRGELADKVAGADTEDFAVHAAIGGGTFSGDPSKETIFKELDSLCPEIQPSDPNPDISNKTAEHITGVYDTPGNVIKSRDYGPPECLEISGIDLPEADIYETCSSKRTAFGGVIDTVVQAGKWAECLVNPEQCTTVEIVGILIDAPYGANHKCEEGFCTDLFMDKSISSKLPPSEAALARDPAVPAEDPSVIPHFITTPCKIRVVDNVRNGIYEVPCIWDLSPYKAVYDQQASIHEPGDPNFPTWEEYWEAVMMEAKRRGAVCGA